MKYVIVLETTSTGYSAYCPDLPGCVATGSTRQECKNSMAEAIAFHLEGLEADGIAIPQPGNATATVEAG